MTKCGPTVVSIQEQRLDCTSEEGAYSHRLHEVVISWMCMYVSLSSPTRRCLMDGVYVTEVNPRES